MHSTETLTKVATLIQWYWENHTREMSLEALHRLQDSLAIHKYYVGSLLAEAEKYQMVETHNRRMGVAKTLLAKKMEKIFDKQVTDKIAEGLATEENEQQYVREIESTAEARKLEITRQDIATVLEAINSRIVAQRQDKAESARTSNIPTVHS